MVLDERARRPTATTDEVPGQVRRLVPAHPGDRVVRQVRAIDAWNARRREQEEQLRACVSRDERLGVARRVDALHRAHQAIAAMTADELAQEQALRPLVPTAVIAHRHAWFADKLAVLLAARGVHVIACTENGADALGAVVAGQPDLVLAGDRLVMISGDQLLTETRLHAPGATRALQASDPPRTARDDVDAVFLRHHLPADVADALVALLPSRLVDSTRR